MIESSTDSIVVAHVTVEAMTFDEPSRSHVSKQVFSRGESEGWKKVKGAREVEVAPTFTAPPPGQAGCAWSGVQTERFYLLSSFQFHRPLSHFHQPFPHLYQS
jgi:hypothetical protein